MKIIKDCSPYYITFIHEDFDKVIRYGQDLINEKRYVISQDPLIANTKKSFDRYLTEFVLPNYKDRNRLKEINPLSKVINFTTDHILFLHSPPGSKHPIHQDGPNFRPHRFSINYPVIVSDDKCITSWYANSGLSVYQENSRMYNVKNTDELKILQSMTLKPNECILFNSELLHDWDNSSSTNDRYVLVFRDIYSNSLGFEDVRKILFGY